MSEAQDIEVTALRRVLARRVENETLRAVARQIGMSPTGLQKFLAGGTPYSATRRRLERWFVRESAQYHAVTTPESARAALAVLTHDLSSRERAALVKRILAVVEDYYIALGETPPSWIRTIKRSP